MDFAKQLRLAMGDMSQQELADRSGVHQSAICKMLLGKAQPRLSTLEKLERSLPELREIRARRKASVA